MPQDLSEVKRRLKKGSGLIQLFAYIVAGRGATIAQKIELDPTPFSLYRVMV